MREILFILGLILMFGFIIYHFYVDFTNYKNSYTLKMGGVFAEGMENPIPASTWNSGGSCPVGCTEPICIDGNCKTVTINGKQYKSCGGTCKTNSNGGCRNNNECSEIINESPVCGEKYFNMNDKTPCKSNGQLPSDFFSRSISQQGGMQQGGSQGGSQGGGMQQGGSQGGGMQQNNYQTVTDQPIIVQEQQQEEQRKVMADNNNMASQPDMENDYASIENPRDFSIFNKDIMKKVLNSKHLIPGDINLAEESQSNYIRVGKSFIEEVSIIRNFSIPDIDETDYETLGRFVVKLKSENISESQKQVYTQKVLKDVYEMLASSSLSTSSVDGENEPIQSTTKRITGMFGDNSNSLMKKKLQLAGVPMDDAKFTDTYKPGKNETKKVQPYNSAWSIF